MWLSTTTAGGPLAINFDNIDEISPHHEGRKTRISYAGSHEVAYIDVPFDDLQALLGALNPDGKRVQGKA